MVWTADCYAFAELKSIEEFKSGEKTITMSKLLRETRRTLKMLLQMQSGQDLVEYALVVALIAFGATAGMSSLAADINTAFTGIGSTVTSYVG